MCLTKPSTLIKKTLSKVGLEGTYFNITKSMYDKHTANIIFNREKLKHQEQDKEVCFHHSQQHSMESTSTTIRQEEIKGNQIGKEEVKLSFADDVILYIVIPKDSTKRLLEQTILIKQQNTKSIFRNQLHFYTPIMNYQKGKLRK